MMVEYKKCEDIVFAMSWISNLVHRIQSTDNNCPDPCERMHISVKPQHKLALNGIERRMTVHLPSTVKYTRSEFTYPLESYVAETGGWVGFFLGLCVVDVFDYIVQATGILPMK